ncbi:MAG: phosphoglucosamine mutase [Candidatus Eremiobacteraeota bacterium]|nr:phosphoglucosamine mutase [Candidatus Eremiobacteraeota bacterium]MBV8497820.1 phosphoglucosamine mutase [Candidatus Eremiobacteraeota bacterium]
MSGLFGTDGVRGVANRDLTPELALRIGRAAASLLPDETDHRPVIVGRDTRVSGSMLEAAIVAGITSVGRDAVSVGIVPTPAVACITRSEDAAAGVVISASHNPIADNGIKFFGPDGFKLSDRLESEIEALVASDALPRPTGMAVGVARLAQNLGRHYYEELYDGKPDLRGLRVVVDGAFGAAYAIAPYALRKLGAEVIEINCDDDGARINVECGATNLEALREAVLANGGGGRRAVGVAFDGDADRALFVDEAGEVVTGDHVMFALGRAMHAAGELRGDTVVGTVMSNIGFERALRRHGITLVRTPVGDRYVLEQMREGEYTLGGEQSGHVVDFRYNTTGDGPRTAVTLLAIVAANATTLHELVREVIVAPQVLVNVRAGNRDVLAAPAVRDEIAAAEAELDGTGRLLIRPSGTEPLIRVMAEGDDAALVEALAARVAARIEQEVGRSGPR